MNNRQAALMAAASFHSGQQASLQDVYTTAGAFEQHLGEVEELVVRVLHNRPGQPKDVEELADLNGRGSFERLVPPHARGDDA